VLNDKLLNLLYGYYLMTIMLSKCNIERSKLWEWASLEPSAPLGPTNFK